MSDASPMKGGGPSQAGLRSLAPQTGLLNRLMAGFPVALLTHRGQFVEAETDTQVTDQIRVFRSGTGAPVEVFPFGAEVPIEADSLASGPLPCGCPGSSVKDFREKKSAGKKQKTY